MKHQLDYLVSSAVHGHSLIRIINRLIHPFLSKFTKKNDEVSIHFQRISLTLVASAFIPFANRTSESASVDNGNCELESNWFILCC